MGRSILPYRFAYSLFYNVVLGSKIKAQRVPLKRVWFGTLEDIGTEEYGGI